MENLSEKDIDYIFQEGSRNHEFPFKSSAWENMEAMLDAEEKERSKRRYILVVVLLISIGSIGGFYFGSNKSKVSPTPKIEKNKTQQIAQQKIDTKLKSENIVNPKSSTSNISSTIKKDLRTNFENKKLGHQSSTSKKLDVQNEVVQDKISENTNHSNTLKNQLIKPELILDVNIQSKTGISSVNKKEYKNTDPSSSEGQITAPTNNEDSFNKDISSMSLPVSDISMISYEKGPIETKIVNYKKSQNNRFAFSLLAGREWSAVGNMSKAKQGFRFGAEVSYLFGNRFQIGSGFIFSRKRYETEGSNYTPQPQFRWVDGEAPQVVNGTCNVFEIPLELTYFFNGNNTNSFFVSAGASTYVMNNEWYDFRWDDQAIMADPNVPKSSSSDNLNRKRTHLFGIGNVSLGYRKYVTKNISAQLSTYVQLPLTGIGMGSVNLFSTGVQMKVSFIK